ncbi:MAG TPA: DUF222 domain-containing protein [Micromonosporaceae bacterium]
MDEAINALAAGVDAVAGRAPWSLPDADLTGAIDGVQRAITRLTGVLALLAREAGGRAMPARVGAVSTVTWLRDQLRISVGEARSLVTLGEILDRRTSLADGLSNGAVTASQANAIGRIVTDLPCDVEPALVDKAEEILIGYASHFEPAILRRLGDRILRHVAPDLDDERLRRRLEREAAHARQRRGFTMSNDGMGGIRLSGTLDTESAAMIEAAIDPLTAPVRDAVGENDTRDTRTAAARRADALVEVCRLAMRTGDLPSHGGQPAQLVVSIDFDALTREVAVGHLDTGAALPPDAIRRLACDAGILPAVLNGAGVPIDLGRVRRLFTGLARQAVIIRDGGCAFPGCDRPPRWCDVHHIKAWSAGGRTDLDNGVALCGFHHRLIHHSDWTVRSGPDHRPEFIPPAHFDASQRPRRNPYHLRT